MGNFFFRFEAMGALLKRKQKACWKICSVIAA